MAKHSNLQTQKDSLCDEITQTNNIVILCVSQKLKLSE